MSGYGPGPTSKPKRELFSEIKRFRAKVEAGEPPIGPLIASSDPRVVDAMGDSIDFIWIDNEHTPMSYESLAGHILAAHLHGVAVIVRVQAPNFNGAAGAPYGWSIKAALDSGADGVIVPQVRTVDEVRSVVSDCRYPTGPNRPPPFDKKQTGPSTHLDYRKRGMG
jgi:2-keto-3-deoxy-L-rhamnonate aldolase RhmA